MRQTPVAPVIEKSISLCGNTTVTSSAACENKRERSRTSWELKPDAQSPVHLVDAQDPDSSSTNRCFSSHASIV
eukprot:6179091-Pleurochrysis_carterae.AAC.2